MKVFFAGENALAPSGWPEEVILKQECSWGCCSFKAVTQLKQRGGQWLMGFRGRIGKTEAQNQVGKALQDHWVQPLPQSCQSHLWPVSPSTTSTWLQAWGLTCVLGSDFTSYYLNFISYLPTWEQWMPQEGQFCVPACPLLPGVAGGWLSSQLQHVELESLAAQGVEVWFHGALSCP